MADVFVSYSRKDGEVAHRFAERLRSIGLSVFMDTAIDTGSSWSKRLEAELNAAAVVVTLWSPNSAASEPVQLEAAWAKRRGVLLPATIDECQIPFEFSGVQSADLIGWQNDLADARLLAFMAEVSQRVRGGTSGRKPIAPRSRAADRSDKRGAGGPADHLPVDASIRAIDAASRINAHYMRLWSFVQACVFGFITYNFFYQDLRVGQVFASVAIGFEQSVWNALGQLALITVGTLFTVAVQWWLIGLASAVLAGVIWLVLVYFPLFFRAGGTKGIYWLNRKLAEAARKTREPISELVAANVSYAAAHGFTMEHDEDGRIVTALRHTTPVYPEDAGNPVYSWRGFWTALAIGFAMSIFGGFWTT